MDSPEFFGYHARFPSRISIVESADGALAWRTKVHYKRDRDSIRYGLPGRFEASMDRGEEDLRKFFECLLALRASTPPSVTVVIQISPPVPDPPPTPAPIPSPSRGKPLDTEARALALLIAHPDWSAARIARELGVARGTLYRSANFRAAMRVRSANRESARNDRRGSRDEIE